MIILNHEQGTNMTFAKLIPPEAKYRLKYDPDSGKLFWAGDNKYHPRLQGKQAGARKNGYIVIKLSGSAYKAHRIAWYLMTGEQPEMIDHINGDGEDNRFHNLRQVNYLSNMKNHGKKVSGSGLPCGVRSTTSGRYQARLTVDYRVLHLGCYACPQEAEAVYLNARSKHYGEYHRRTK